MFYLLIFFLVALIFVDILPFVLVSGIYLVFLYYFRKKEKSEPKLLFVLCFSIVMGIIGYSFYAHHNVEHLGKEMAYAKLFSVAVKDAPSNYKPLQVLEQDYEKFLNGADLITYDRTTFKKTTYPHDSIVDMIFSYQYNGSDFALENLVAKRLRYERVLEIYFILYAVLISSFKIRDFAAEMKNKQAIKLYLNYQALFDTLATQYINEKGPTKMRQRFIDQLDDEIYRISNTRENPKILYLAFGEAELKMMNA